MVGVFIHLEFHNVAISAPQQLRFNGRFLRAPFLRKRVNALPRRSFAVTLRSGGLREELRVERGAVIERRNKLADG